MKFLHLGDLHLGKKVNDFSMLEEQKDVLNQAVKLVLKNKIDVVLIAGDVFDRAVPSVFALELFSDFLDELNKLKTKVFIISGNHDNNERLSYLNPILEKSDIFISKPFDGKLQKFDLEENISVYLMPYLYPGVVKNFYPDIDITNYNDAIKTVIKKVKLDKKRINILLAHQFVSGLKPLQLSESEQKSVGGIDIVDYKIFKKFDYTALGHLHCSQSAGSDNIRYCGSILKYSFSEINQKKSFTIFEFDKNKNLKLNFENINFPRDLKEYKGYIKDFLDEDFYSKIKTDDYIHFILLDDDALDAKKRLSLIYPNIMILEFDNKYTKNNSICLDENFSKDKTMFEHFCDFYKNQLNCALEEEKSEIVKNIIDKIKGVD